MKKHFFSLALLIAASVASDAATITAEPSIATDAQNIRQGEGLPKDDGPHLLGHTKASRRLERRGFADKVKASKAREAEEANSNPQTPPQQPGPAYAAPGPANPQTPPQQPGPAYAAPGPAYGAPGPAYGAPGPAYGAPGPAYGAPGPAYGAPGPAYGAPGPAYGYGRPHGESEYEYAPSAPSAPYEWQPSASSQYETAQHGGRVNNPDRPIIESTLRRIIKHNQLEAFYNEQGLQKVLDRLDTVDFNTLGTSVGGIEKEIALDLASLALYDIVFFCDDSGSMVIKDTARDYNRIEDLKAILKAVTEIVLHFDNNGISVRFLNDIQRKAADGIKKEADVEKLIPDPIVDRFMFNGMTPLGTNFNEKVLRPEIVDKAVSNRLEKPVLAIIITDGEPSENEDIFINNVLKAEEAVTLSSRFGPGAFAIQIAQVGVDKRAHKYLERLDNDDRVGHKIDTTSPFEFEQKEFMEKNKIELTPGLWLVKMCVGAIDPAYDQKDEKKKK